MCELFAVNTSRKVYLNDYLTTFFSHSVDHPHGWGMGYFFNDGKVHIIKEAHPAYDSEYLQDVLRKEIYKKNFIGHIRLATKGKMILENCHPFLGEDESKRRWTLAHNGTIFQSELLEQYKDKTEGSTDSERVHCHIIRRANELLKQTDNQPSVEDRCAMMNDIILEIVEHNKLNLMVFDGEVLYVHTNMKDTLCYKTIAEGFVFATTPLDDEEWKPLPMMQLFAYSNGKLIYSGTKHDYEYFLEE